MSFMLALPKISLHGCGAIEDMVKLLAQKQWGKALIVTDGQLVELGLLEGLFNAMQQHTLPYAMFNEVFPTLLKNWCNRAGKRSNSSSATI